MAEDAVRCEDASVRYGEVLALPPTSFALAPGESIAILGPSGSGKSTLLACLQGLATIGGGSLVVLGQDQARASRRARSDLRRRRMGLIQQSADLLPEFSTAENVAFPLLFDGMRREQALGIADEALSGVGLAHRRDADVGTLSGGEAQRVAVARALVGPDLALLVADEPTASLDVDNARTVSELLLAEAARRGATVVLATHDLAVAGLCDRTLHLRREHEAA